MNINEIINSAKYTDHDPEKVKPSILIKNKIVATPGNFITLNGLPKNYKSTVMGFFVASALTGAPVHEISVSTPGGVCIIDTEQTLNNFSRQMKRLKRLINAPALPSNFSAYCFRQFDPPIILDAIKTIANNPEINFLILDNLTELVVNPNDMTESKAVIQLLKKITATRPDLTIMALLHLGKTTANSLGNLGSYADRAAEAVLKVQYNKDYNQINLEPVYMRSDADFSPLAFTYNPETYNFDQTEPAETKRPARKFVLMELTREDHFNRLGAIFASTKEIPYSELIEEIKKIYGVGGNIAKQQILPYLAGNKFLISNKGIYKQF